MLRRVLRVEREDTKNDEGTGPRVRSRCEGACILAGLVSRVEPWATSTVPLAGPTISRDEPVSRSTAARRWRGRFATSCGRSWGGIVPRAEHDGDAANDRRGGSAGWPRRGVHACTPLRGIHRGGPGDHTRRRYLAFPGVPAEKPGGLAPDPEATRD